MAQANQLQLLWDGFEYKEHQVFGVNWMLARENAEGPRGGILADEMGLGKTIQMAGLIKNADHTFNQDILLVLPIAVIPQWKTVFQRSGMGVRVPATKGGATWITETTGTSLLAPQIHILGYELLTRNPGLGTLYTWDRVIFDEAHRLNGDSIRGIALTLRFNKMWLLTATPITNTCDDIFNLLRVVGVEEPLQPKSNLLAHRQLFQTYILSRTMDQLRLAIPDAPPVPTIHKMVLEFQTEDEAEFYRGISGIITRRWQALEEDRTAGAGLERLKLFMRLRQLSLHPQVYIQARKKMLRGLYARPDWLNTSTKFQKIGELIGSQQEQRRWIVFCHFRTEMELLEAALKKDLRIGRVQQYNGSLSHEEKRAVIQRTHEPLEGGGHEVLLVQLQSGGVGLNLQHFDRIIFTGPWWTEAMMVQAIGRAVRIGQREVVNVYHIVLKEEIALNIDAYMQEKAEAKGKLCKAVIAMATRTIAAA